MTRIVKTTYPTAFGKYGDMEDRMNQLGQMRSKSRLCKCIVCKRPFQRTDDVYLAVMEHGKNKFICGRCAEREEECMSS